MKTAISTFSPHRRMMLATLLSMAFMALLSSAAFAAMGPYDTTMGNSVCFITGVIMFGNAGRAIATIAVITIGISAMLGRVSWGTALIVATGIAITFGAYNLAGMLGAGGTCDYT